MHVRLLLLSLVLAAPALPAQEQLDLRDGWQLQSSALLNAAGEKLSESGLDTTAWRPTQAPRTVLAALVDNGVYPDPYYGLNLKSIPGYRDGLHLVMPEDSPFRAPWWYRTEFDVAPGWAGRTITLHLDGINFRANVWLNGRLIADGDTVRGMFRRFEFNVTPHIRAGARNTLAIETIPPGLIPDKNYNTKQVEATTGWDDHNPQPPDMNLGIWQPVYLRAQGPVTLRHPYVEPTLGLPALDRAELTVSAFLTNHSDRAVTGTYSARIEQRVAAAEVTLQPGETREVIIRPADAPALVVEHPRVWWPHPAGAQELYNAHMEFTVGSAVSDAADLRFGIRDADTYINDEDWRGYKINGRNILIRGGAWMTIDMLLRLDRSRYEALVRYAREANLNMLRSEGFSIRETGDFYALCDELGVMVTQQIFGRSIPDEDLALACIEDMLLRIRNHPSLVHFLGHDETFPTKRLDEGYQALLEKHRIRRTYQPHSGTFNVMTRKSTGGTRTGTRELWTYASPAHYYFRTFDGAWGFAQSGGIGGILATRDSLRQMMPEDQLWPPLKTEAWSFHTVTQGGDYFDAVMRAMDAGYGAPADFDDFCRKAYAMNYNSARGMFEAYARNKYEATGITTWKYNAAWPAAMTWHYIDWYLRPTAAWYGAKKACEALHVQYAYDDHGVYVLNSLYEPARDLEVRARILDFDLTGKFTRTATVDVEPDGKSKAFEIELPKELSSTYFLLLELYDAGALRSRNFYWLSTTPDLPGRSGERRGTEIFYTEPKSRADFSALQSLPPVALELSHTLAADGGDRILSVDVANPTDALAFQIELAATGGKNGSELAPVYWDDNFFSLLPGERRTLQARIPEHAFAQDTVPALRATGWNIRPRQ